MYFRQLPWEYATRNLFRRPVRTVLTFAGLTTVVFLVLVVVGFIRGLERSLVVSGDPRTAIVFSLGMGENLEYSSIPMRTVDLISASVPSIERRYQVKYASPELYLGTRIRAQRQPESSLGLVRGVTMSAPLVRRQVELEQGEWPGPGEVIVGQLVAAKLGASAEDIAIGKQLELEGRTWNISGLFSARGSAFESEVWCRLDDLQQAMKRQDLSLVAVTLSSPDDFADLDLFCKERLDLELQAMKEVDYYETLQRHYRPVRSMAWIVVLLVSGAGIFSGLNAMYSAVVGRTTELAMLQTIGFSRRAIVVSLLQEGILLTSMATLMAAFLAICFVNGTAVRFTMGAFAMQIDSVAMIIGCVIGVLLGGLGTLPPVMRAFRMPVATALKAI